MQKSAFSQVYEELKKQSIEFPQEFSFYKKEQLVNLWSSTHISNPAEL